MGSISLGVAFVAGKKRVPKPAAGITALVMVLKRMHIFYTPPKLIIRNYPSIKFKLSFFKNQAFLPFNP